MESIVGDFQVILPFIDVVKMVLNVNKYMKDIITDKIKLEMDVMILTHECSPILQNMMPETREDLKSFTLPMLVWLDASVSLMPRSVLKHQVWSPQTHKEIVDHLR